MKIIKREGKINGKLSLNIDVTSEYIPDGNKKAELFELLNDKKEIDQKGLLRLLKLADKEYRWNYVEDKKYPCNETRGQLLLLLGKAGIDNSFLTKTAEMELWHMKNKISDARTEIIVLFDFSNNYDIRQVICQKDGKIRRF